MKRFAIWLLTPIRLLPWYHSLLLGIVGGFMVGISVGILLMAIVVR